MIKRLRRWLRSCRKRTRLALAALRGYDFILDDRTTPGNRIGAGSFEIEGRDFRTTAEEERRGALLSRATEKEIRWYVLHQLLKKIENEPEEGEEMLLDFSSVVGVSGGDIRRLVYATERDAYDEAVHAISQRMELHEKPEGEFDDEGHPIEHIFRDPRLEVKFRIAPSAADRLRMSYEEFIQHYGETFPERVLALFLEEEDEWNL